MTRDYINRLLIIGLFIISLPVFVFAQQTQIFGNVTDEKGNPLELVSVALKGYPTGTSTLANGKYSINCTPGKQYEVYFSSVGYKTFSIVVWIKKEKKELNVTLKEASEQLIQIDIEDKYVRKTSLTRLDPKIISLLPDAAGNFEGVLKTLPGVSSSNELSSQYSVRGGNFDENLVYVNDIQIYRPLLIRSGQQEGMSFINPDMVSSVLFSAGGFDAKYGDKLSSVLDIKYKKPTEFGVSASVSLLGTSLTLQGDSKDHRFTHISGVRYKSSKYILNSMQTKGDYFPRFFDFQTYLSYDLTDRLEISFLGNIAQNVYKFIPKEKTTTKGTINQPLQLRMFFDGMEVDKFDNYTGALVFDFKTNENLSLKLIGSSFTSNESESFDIQAQYWINQLDSDLGSETLGDSIANLGVGTYLKHARNYLFANVYSIEHKGLFSKNNNFLQWGVKAQTENIKDKLSEWKMIDSADYSIPMSDTIVKLFYSTRSNHETPSNRYSAFVQNTYNIITNAGELSLTAGIRSVFWSFNNEFKISPRGNIAFKPNWENDFLFRFSTGIFYQPPFYKEMRNSQGAINNNIKFQKSLHFVLGSDYNFKAWNRPFKLITELYYKKLSNIISYTVDNVRLIYSGSNDASGYATGLDLKINGEFVKDVDSWFSLSILKTMEDIDNDDHFEKDESGNEVWVKQGYIRRPSDQRVNVGVFFQDYFPNRPDYKMHLQINYGSNIPYGAPNTPRWTHTGKMQSYQRVDIGFSKSLKRLDKVYKRGQIMYWFKDAWISLEVFNLLGRLNTISHEWATTYTGRSYAFDNHLTGRRVNIKLSAKF